MRLRELLPIINIMLNYKRAILGRFRLFWHSLFASQNSVVFVFVRLNPRRNLGKPAINPAFQAAVFGDVFGKGPGRESVFDCGLLARKGGDVGEIVLAWEHYRNREGLFLLVAFGVGVED